MNPDIIIPLLVSFAITVVLGPVVIPFLQRLKVGQTEREEGVQSHLKKAGTPTMGGLMMLIAVTVTALIYIGFYHYSRIIPLLFLMLGFGLIGFLDDYLKVVLHRSDGLYPKQKMLGQIIVTTIFVVYIWKMDRSCLDLIIPFTGGKTLTADSFGGAFRYLSIPLAYFVIIGTVNGVNFTDGLDGLASSVTLMVAIFFTAVSMTLGGEIEPMTAAVAGALLGFLLFNVYPAKVFMGDTGSLALGGFVAGSAYLLRMPVFILIVGLIYLVEVLSVIIQVTYFKATGGKRFFKMAPIHHHFELCGWSETRIVTVFTIVTAFLCLLALYAL
ncbi:MAG: phospho-N-acetylmuramoyl-pentapeptide-transferase [Clostridiales bacterium]|nr:phospho-N-acetylmuramoyl-pentapeptide-transferase [Clostridiales bacterium]